MVHGLSCSEACGIFAEQRRKLCPLHWHAECYPLYRQGRLSYVFFNLMSPFLSSFHEAPHCIFGPYFIITQYFLTTNFSDYYLTFLLLFLSLLLIFFFWLHWVFAAALGLSLVADYEWVLEGAGSVDAMCWLSCPSACGILVPNQGSNLICLHWKVDSPPLDHHGRLYHYFSSLPITVVVPGFLVNTLIFLNSSFRRIEQREHRVPIYSLSP